MTKDEKYISRCLELARNGLCTTPPNPMVGAVIVCKNRIIGEGYHIHHGQAHAEVNAIQSVKEKDIPFLKEATMYVSLEPCSHYGKTPPCADLIIEKGIPHVVVGCLDPFPLVAGRGIKRLRDAGIDVKVGVLEEECRQLNRKFITFNTNKRPYIILKWAESTDKFIGKEHYNSNPIILSSNLTQMLVHKKRSENSAILVGRRTALMDNPSLTTRVWYGKNPVRITIDKDLTLPSIIHFYDGKVPTIIFTSKAINKKVPNTEFIQLDFSSNILLQIMNVIYNKKLQSLLVEGGAQLLQSFIDSNLWDEAFVEESPIKLKDGTKAPNISNCYLKDSEIHFGRTIKHYNNLYID
jgi:diaminohydroxyphosphoribosylaminopyrimidine deaminase/5-amino-6-(5-phosphoribosylamino)uracil reductase